MAKRVRPILPMVGSYEGDEMYVYASYDRADADLVANILANAKKGGARISFDPNRLAGSLCMVAFLSHNAKHSRLVWNDLEVAHSLYMDVTCFYLDDFYLGKEEEKRLGFRFVHLEDVSILQYAPILESHFPQDVYPGPPKKVNAGN